MLHLRSTEYPIVLATEMSMMHDLTPKLGRKRRAAWGAHKSIEDVVEKIRNTQLRAHFFNITVLPALTYASETWALSKQEENAVSVTECAVERVMTGVSRCTQLRDDSKFSPTSLCRRDRRLEAPRFLRNSK
ncbi:hypothetical protein RB195_001263 [Necator americanus]|uniref:Reverse transcriptase domain-containing protein n=1 Tax=Necator americanus TaxID=51031 RepID=A0ABR1DEA8_NECAM